MIAWVSQRRRRIDPETILTGDQPWLGRQPHLLQAVALPLERVRGRRSNPIDFVGDVDWKRSDIRQKTSAFYFKSSLEFWHLEMDSLKTQLHLNCCCCCCCCAYRKGCKNHLAQHWHISHKHWKWKISEQIAELFSRFSNLISLI